MLRKTVFLAMAALAVSLATNSEAQAWGACHVGYTHVGYGGVQHYGYTGVHAGYGGYGGYHYGGYGYGGYHYGGYGYGDARYGYVRRW